MHHKIVENYFVAICGVFGFGVSWTNIAWADALPKILIASISALMAGGMGYIGKLMTVWAIRKCKSVIYSIKKNRQK